MLIFGGTSKPKHVSIQYAVLGFVVASNEGFIFHWLVFVETYILCLYFFHVSILCNQRPFVREMIRFLAGAH